MAPKTLSWSSLLVCFLLISTVFSEQILFRIKVDHAGGCSNIASMVSHFRSDLGKKIDSERDIVQIGKVCVVIADLEANERELAIKKFRNIIVDWELQARYAVATEQEVWPDVKGSPYRSTKAFENKNQHIFQNDRMIRQEWASYGLFRTTVKHMIDQPGLEKYYLYDKFAMGNQVDVFILGQGIDESMPEFGGRAQWLGVFANTSKPHQDEPHWSTHVASVIGGKEYGFAKSVGIKMLKVVGDDQRAYKMDLLRALQKIYTFTDRPHKILMCTVFGARSEILNAAFDEMTQQGIHVVVPAGGIYRGSKDACEFSPASAKSVITVGGIDLQNMIYYNNFGPCIDIMAIERGIGVIPGVPGTPGGGMSGTSQAACHAAGVIAVLISKYLSYGMEPPSVTEMKQLLIDTSTSGEIDFRFGQKRKYHDRLLYLDPYFDPTQYQKL